MLECGLRGDTLDMDNRFKDWRGSCSFTADDIRGNQKAPAYMASFEARKEKIIAKHGLTVTRIEVAEKRRLRRRMVANQGGSKLAFQQGTTARAADIRRLR